MKELYLAQYVEAGPTVDLQLKSKQIKILSAEVDGWSCEFSDHGQEVIIMYCMFYVIIQNIQVSRKNVEQYTGVGKPPYCEMTLRAASDSTPPDLTLPVTLTGVKQPTTIILEREHETGKLCIADTHHMCTCVKCSITSFLSTVQLL